MTSVPLNGVQSQPLVAELEALRHEMHQLLLLAYEAVTATNDALGKVTPRGSELREAALLYMATVPNRQLRKDLITARGPQAAAVLRTKLNADLEQRRGRRHASNGQAAVHANGNGAALAAAE